MYYPAHYVGWLVPKIYIYKIYIFMHGSVNQAIAAKRNENTAKNVKIIIILPEPILTLGVSEPS